MVPVLGTNSVCPMEIAHLGNAIPRLECAFRLRRTHRYLVPNASRMATAHRVHSVTPTERASRQLSVATVWRVRMGSSATSEALVCRPDPITAWTPLNALRTKSV